MIILLMGVAGSGKTTVGELLASQLHWKFIDGDSFHSAENVAKMSSGIPLTDADRAPWLAALRASIKTWLRTNENIALAASALKQKYRDELLIDPSIKLVYLRSTPEAIHDRLQARTNHFMNSTLADSQFADLEEPSNAITIDADLDPTEIVRSIRTQLNL